MVNTKVSASLMNTHKRSFAIVIPVYNHETSVYDVVTASMQLDFPVVVVDDGSTDASYARIKDIPDIRILRHPVNQGKGAALVTGFMEASRFADWAITLDADGQHDPLDAVNMIRSIPTEERELIIGARQGMAGANVPWTSRFGRYFSNFWVRVSGGPVVADSQSGFRIYPLPEIIDLKVVARRFQYEVEVLVLAHRAGIPVKDVPVSVNYGDSGVRVSHFRPFRDFIRNSQTFSRLIFQRIFTSQLR